MLLEAIVAPHTPQVLFLAAFASFDEMIETRRKLVAQPGLQRAHAGWESAETDPVEPAQSQILLAAPDSLAFHARPTRREGGIFELRSYRAPAWHDRAPAAVGAAFRRSGIHPIMHASTAAEHLSRFTYLVPFSSLIARQDAWTKLDRDPDWIGLQRESRTRFGSEAKVTGASIYTLAPYSPLA